MLDKKAAAVKVIQQYIVHIRESSGRKIVTDISLTKQTDLQEQRRGGEIKHWHGMHEMSIWLKIFMKILT